MKVLEAQLREAKSALADLQALVERVTSLHEESINTDGPAEERQLTASTSGEISYDGTRFVVNADLQITGVLTADSCACSATTPAPTISSLPSPRPSPSPTTAAPTPAWYLNVPTVTDSSTCTGAGGSNYYYCSSESFHYCCGVCDGAKTCSGAPGYEYCACYI